jgi:hypothetical protein
LEDVKSKDNINDVIKKTTTWFVWQKFMQGWKCEWRRLWEN